MLVAHYNSPSSIQILAQQLCHNTAFIYQITLCHSFLIAFHLLASSWCWHGRNRIQFSTCAQLLFYGQYSHLFSLPGLYSFRPNCLVDLLAAVLHCQKYILKYQIFWFFHIASPCWVCPTYQHQSTPPTNPSIHWFHLIVRCLTAFLSWSIRVFPRMVFPLLFAMPSSLDITWEFNYCAFYLFFQVSKCDFEQDWT